jgi:hypothetical protein
MKITNYFFLMIIALSAFNLNAKAQCTQPLDDCSLGVTIPPLVQCPGSTYLFNPILEPGFSYTGEVWTPGSGPSWITGWSPASLVIPPGTAPGVYSYSLNVTGLGPEQIIDGDFSSTVNPCGYTTDYTYTTGAGTIPEPYLDPYGGYYSITDNITSVTTPGAPFALLGEPHMLAINGFATGPSNVWAEKLTVCPGATYQFSFDYAAWTTGGGPAQPNIQVNIGSSYFPALFVTSGTWTTQTYIWTAPAAPGPYTVQITDLTGALLYNDLAITNISFKRIINGSIPFTVKVLAPPSATIIPGPVSALCVGGSLPFTIAPGSTLGGTWSSSNPTKASVSTTGIVTGLSGGMTVIHYTVTNSCGTYDAITKVYVLDACLSTTDYTSVTITGFPSYPPGVIVTYDIYDNTGVLLYSGLTGYVGEYIHPLPAGTNVFCLTSISFMGVTCPLNCCIHNLFPAPRFSNSQTIPSAKDPNNNLAIIPNPNKGAFTIQGTIPDLAPSAEVNFEVLDILGKTIITDIVTIENGSINKTITLADNIANGMYMVRIKADGTNKIIKFTLDR